MIDIYYKYRSLKIVEIKLQCYLTITIIDYEMAYNIYFYTNLLVEKN